MICTARIGFLISLKCPGIGYGDSKKFCVLYLLWSNLFNDCENGYFIASQFCWTLSIAWGVFNIPDVSEAGCTLIFKWSGVTV
jgi:hypothetical protein